MNWMKILVGAMFALLLALIGYAYTLQGGNKTTTAVAKLEKLEQENRELALKVERLDTKLELLLSGRLGGLPEPRPQVARPAPSRRSPADYPPADRSIPDQLSDARDVSSSQAEDDEVQRVIEEERKKRLEAERIAALQAEENATLAQQTIEKQRPALKNERLVRERDAIAVIREWAPDYSMAILDVIGQPELKQEDKLMVRRKGKIIGQLSVDAVEIDGVITSLHPPVRDSSMLPDFKQGDEVIFPPLN